MKHQKAKLVQREKKTGSKMGEKSKSGKKWGKQKDSSPGARSPLRSAVQAQDSDMARLLLQARADPNDRDAKGVCVPWRGSISPGFLHGSNLSTSFANEMCINSV